MIFTKHAKNDLPWEGKKLVFLTFLVWKTRFPHENIAISLSFFQGVFHASFGLVFEVFWGLSGAPPGAKWDPSGPQLGHFAASWVSWVASWSLVGPIWASVGWLCAFLEALWRKSGHQLGDSVSLGSDLASFGYLVCESSFLPYLWMPLVEFVGIGEAGLDLCQCVSIGAELHTKPNAHTCATYLYMCTCWSIIWHARLLQQTIENY